MGHGSHLNPDSSAPVYQHAAAIRRLGLFDEVLEAFWKEEPSLPHALDLVSAEEIWIVPIFLAEGYFTRQVVPRELGLSGPLARPRHQTIRYCDPVGTHPLMGEMILRRALATSGLSADERAGAALLIIGHGTERSATSGDTVYRLVEQLRASGEFGTVDCGFLDEEPNIADVLEKVEADRVVLVPFFIADGWHTATTIPKDLALDGVVTRRGGRTIWYTPPVGTLPDVAEVILALTGSAIAAPDEVPGEALPDDSVKAEPAAVIAPTGGGVTRQIDPSDPAGEGKGRAEEARGDRDAFFEWIDASPAGRIFLEARIRRGDGDVYELRNRSDSERPVSELVSSSDPEVALEIARYTDGDEYRPLRTAATLRRGWVLTLSRSDAWRAISLLYPATVSYWNRPRLAEITARAFEAWAGRQTGIYSSLRQLTPDLLPEVVAGCCVAGRCQRTRLWRYDEVLPAGDDAARGGNNGIDATPMIPCPEPCTLFGTIAREKLYAITTCEGAADATP